MPNHKLFKDLDAATTPWPWDNSSQCCSLNKRTALESLTYDFDFLVEIFRCVDDPGSPEQISELYNRVVNYPIQNGLATFDLKSTIGVRPKRSFTTAELLNSGSFIDFTKGLFSRFFKIDNRPIYDSSERLILSKGSFDEQLYPMDEVLKECINFSLNSGWYGYSSSLGRDSTREALAQLESNKIGFSYSMDNVALTLGATHAIGMFSGFLKEYLKANNAGGIALIPNYPPLLASLRRNWPLELVPADFPDGNISIKKLIDNISVDTPFVLLQTVINPLGLKIPEPELEQLIDKCYPNTLVILDESHEYFQFGNQESPSSKRGYRNVIRVNTTSKGLSTPGIKTGWLLADTNIIKHFYEFASVFYGSPPSLFYLMLEVWARFENWEISKVNEVSNAQLLEFESGYCLTKEKLSTAFDSYRQSKCFRRKDISENKALLIEELEKKSIGYIYPDYSINLCLDLNTSVPDYAMFLSYRNEKNISIYPGILNFFHTNKCLQRISFMIDKQKLIKGISRL